MAGDDLRDIVGAVSAVTAIALAYKVARHGLGSVTSGDVLLALGLAALRSRPR